MSDWPVKIGTKSWNFRNELRSGALTTEGLLRAAAAMGIDGVELLTRELRAFTLERMLEYRSVGSDLGVEIAALAIENDFAHPNARVRRAEIETVRMWTRIAGLAGVPFVKLFTGDADPRVDAAVQREWVREALLECAETAEACDVTIVVENHSDVCFAPADLISLVGDVGHARCRLCPDAYNCAKFVGGEVVYDAALAMARHAPYLHVQFFEIDDGGRELRVDIERLLAIYRDAGYRGYLMIEWHGKADPYWAVSNIAGYVRGLVSS